MIQTSVLCIAAPVACIYALALHCQSLYVLYWNCINYMCTTVCTAAVVLLVVYTVLFSLAKSAIDVDI